MTARLTAQGYDQTRKKLENLERRLAEIELREDLAPEHKAEVRRSYDEMICQYRKEMKLYETANFRQTSSPP